MLAVCLRGSRALQRPTLAFLLRFSLTAFALQRLGVRFPSAPPRKSEC